ncbi:MAG: DNA-binding protein, partial [Prevotellaceae bacterium]|nr:DNA-binding protein [Prevotellaceae bacterium]
KLGNWGSFSVSLHTAGAATQKELKTTAIKGVNMVFHPSDAVKAELQKSNFVWLEKLVNDTSNDGNKDAQIPEAPDSLG